MTHPRESTKEVTMIAKYLGLGLVAITISSCVYPVDYDDDDFRPRERGRSECVEQAHASGYRRVDVQSARRIDRATWEIIMNGRAPNGREFKLSCQYDVARRRASVDRVE
jgi:hypothetical protein